MGDTDDETLRRRIQDIVAVVATDIDSVRVDVEDGVAYLEGVVSGPDEAQAILQATGKLRGLTHIVTWLSTEKLLAVPTEVTVERTVPPPVLMHYHSQS